MYKLKYQFPDVFFIFDDNDDLATIIAFPKHLEANGLAFDLLYSMTWYALIACLTNNVLLLFKF